MKTTAGQWVTLIVLSLIVLVVKAYVMLPFLWRGIEGQGLYRVISAWQFGETAVFTWLVITWLAWRRWRLRAGRAGLLGASCALLNFGVMVLDARLQAFPGWIEARILERYGAPATLYGVAALAIVAGLAFSYLLLARTPAGVAPGPPPAKAI